MTKAWLNEADGNRAYGSRPSRLLASRRPHRVEFLGHWRQIIGCAKIRRLRSSWKRCLEAASQSHASDKRSHKDGQVQQPSEFPIFFYFENATHVVCIRRIATFSHSRLMSRPRDYFLLSVAVEPFERPSRPRSLGKLVSVSAFLSVCLVPVNRDSCLSVRQTSVLFSFLVFVHHRRSHHHHQDPHQQQHPATSTTLTSTTTATTTATMAVSTATTIATRTTLF